MSIKVMQAVWESSAQKGSALLLLLAIADWCRDDGDGAFPSIKTIARRCRMSVRNTQILINRVKAAGEIEVDLNAGPGGCNIYRVKTLQGVKRTSPDGAKKSQIGVKGPSPISITSVLGKSRPVVLVRSEPGLEQG
ncbi:MAG: hypothetical protein DMF61_24840, partial [Blastocatellia bacterium AA13]